MVKKALFSFLILLFQFGTVANSQAATIRTFVDRTDISVNESFNLVFEAEGSVDGDPDFSPLTLYFDILNQSQSSNVSIINGNFSKKTVWTLVLMSKQPGQFTIPSIEFGADRSPVLTVKVSAASARPQTSQNEHLFLEAEVDSPTAYVQSQLIYTVRLFRAVEIQNASLTEPKLSDADAIVEKLGEDKRYQTTRNNMRYIVIERRYAIFPQQSGHLTIEPLEFNGQLVTQRRSFFDISPLNNVTKRLYSDKIDLTIKPVPAAFKNKLWLPSAEVKLVEEWPDNFKLKVGEPVTRTISLLANGLTAAQLPEIHNTDIKGLKQYPDQATLNNQQNEKGIVGIRQEKIALIPTQAGKLLLPEISIPWWNTKTEQIEYARIPSRQFDVIADATQPQPQPSIAQPLAAPAPLTEPTGNEQASSTATFWPWLSLFLAVGWVATLSLYFRQNKLPATPRIPAKTTPNKTSLAAVERRLRSACNQNNAALCKTILIEWATLKWPQKKINALADIGPLVDDALREQLEQLQQILYAANSSEKKWTNSQLLSAFENFKGKPLDKTPDASEELKPLHEIQ